ncbi:MAG: FAD-dependent oxidoreductase [Deltaproteobacteria bacterium]|nr:FAD-dependent oxidoreductase [Deltaproteobacteria bacterium]
MTASYDVAIVGGGPAGSTCARTLVAGGAKVVVIDRSTFPRVKLCAGWLSAGIWDVLELAPRDYPRALWEWRHCHVHYRGKSYRVPGKGWFIRRFELDDFLLQRAGAELRLGAHVKQLTRDGDGWAIELPDGSTVHAGVLVGAGGTNCPVARLAAPPRPRRALGVQEIEVEVDPGAIERTRLGRDGEPELLLFDHAAGYGWNVPKHGWLNVGCGTLDATAVHDAWKLTHDHLRSSGHLPQEIEPELEHLKGHSYFLYDPTHLEGAARDHALLVGDSLGLAHPITGEGILPATISGRVAAEAILAGAPNDYPVRLARHEVIADYRRVHRVMAAARRLRRPSPESSRSSRLGRYAVARGFAWMFSGSKLPLPGLVDRALDLMPGKS